MMTGFSQPERAHQVVQIEDEVPEAVVRRRLAVAVPAQVERDDVEAVEQAAREIVEGMRVIAQPVHDDQRRRGRVAPIAKVNAQACRCGRTARCTRASRRAR